MGRRERHGGAWGLRPAPSAGPAGLAVGGGWSEHRGSRASRCRRLRAGTPVSASPGRAALPARCAEMRGEREAGPVEVINYYLV